MTTEMHIVASPCVGVKDRACIPACPVDCIYQLKDGDPNILISKANTEYPVSAALTQDQKDMLAKMVVIKRDECIGWGACVDPCPVGAIFPESEVPQTDKDKQCAELNDQAFG